MHVALTIYLEFSNSSGEKMTKASWQETITVLFLGLVQTMAIVIIARGLIQLISLCTNLFYHGRLSFADAGPDPHAVGLISMGIPVLGGLLVGLMARYGSHGIRGHGIPEAMESILIRESRIPKRLTVLKPLSSAIAIGSGGPFGAEGPIIATGGAVGSLIGQFLPLHESSRKILSKPPPIHPARGPPGLPLDEYSQMPSYDLD
jgi:H+/Cl- antiporter ClcA